MFKFRKLGLVLGLFISSQAFASAWVCEGQIVKGIWLSIDARNQGVLEIENESTQMKSTLNFATVSGSENHVLFACNDLFTVTINTDSTGTIHAGSHKISLNCKLFR